jgi:uncharacterized protein involved in type VI secretion and phage assembly
MALYDILNEISQHQITKTDTGDTRVTGVMVGIVAKNYDKDMPGRVCVTIPTRDKDLNELQWARHCQPAGGSGWGFYFQPEVGDQVLLAFEGGNIEKPYVIGCVQKDKDKFLSGSVDEKNQTKRIVTKHGSHITFWDDANDDKGEKDKITVETAGKMHTFLMDNANKVINLTDKDKKNFMKLRTGDGVLQVKVEKKLEIKVGETITITLNGENGAISVKGNSFRGETSQSYNIKSDGMVQIEGANVANKASAMFKVESSGMVNVTGTPIKLG